MELKIELSKNLERISKMNLAETGQIIIFSPMKQ